MTAQAAGQFDPASITRPEPALMTYYALTAAMTLVGFPFVILPLYFKYHTLRYRFDDKGIAMSYGILFRRETYLTYRRIQDIHVTRNLVQRWLGLASVAVQTASGSSGAEMTIEGIREPERLRDFLYGQMRGGHDDRTHGPAAHGGTAPLAASMATPSATPSANPSAASLATPSATPFAAPDGSGHDEALALLAEIRDEIRRLRGRWERPGTGA